MALFAVRVTLMDDKLHTAMLDFAILIRRHQAWIATGSRTGGLGVEERIATVGTEKVEFVITSFRRLSVLPSELFVLHADVAFIHDRCSTMEATFREEFVVIKVAIRKPLVFVKRDVLEPLGAVRTHEASRMVGCS